MDSNLEDGRVLSDPALVSDQAPAGLAPSGFDPSHWLGFRYSPNLNRWLALNAKRGIRRPRVYRDRDGILWIGRMDDDGWFTGTRIMRCLTEGGRAEVGAYGHLSESLTECPDFWREYDEKGRCAIDTEHRVGFIGEETRWTVNGDRRSCRWCGEAVQRLERWTETVERSRWVDCDSDRSGEAVETTGSTEGESAGLQGIAPTSSALSDTEGR